MAGMEDIEQLWQVKPVESKSEAYILSASYTKISNIREGANLLEFISQMKPPNRRQLQAEKKEEERRKLEFMLDCIRTLKWPHLSIQQFGSRGRGLVATQAFTEGSVVCHYHGTVYKGQEARTFVKYMYSQFKSNYVFEILDYGGIYYGIDATEEDDSQGRLVNHGCHPNLKPTPSTINGEFYILFKAVRDIAAGEELLYDYGQRAGSKSDRYPWLNWCPDTCRKCESKMVNLEVHILFQINFVFGPVFMQQVQQVHYVVVMPGQNLGCRAYKMVLG